MSPIVKSLLTTLNRQISANLLTIYFYDEAHGFKEFRCSDLEPFPDTNYANLKTEP